MHILYTLNDKFVPQVAAWICSICENNKDEKITFYLIWQDISEKNQLELKNLVNRYNKELNIYDLQPLNTYFDFNFDTKWWNSIILARLLVDKILPENIDRLLYLDWDTIVKWNLKSLREIDMWEKTIWMSIEPTTDKKRKDCLWLHNYPYFNSWVLLIDLKWWREKQCWRIIINYYKDNFKNCFAPDQDAINVSMKDEIYILPPKYNFYNIFWQYPYKFMVKLMDNVPYFSKEIYDESCKNPIIIHYLWEERPRRKWNTHKYREDYKKYLWMTVWKNTLDEEWWKLYFFCWNFFNFITKPFPCLRYKIINSLIPAFMKIRAKKLKK